MKNRIIKILLYISIVALILTGCNLDTENTSLKEETTEKNEENFVRKEKDKVSDKNEKKNIQTIKVETDYYIQYIVCDELGRYISVSTTREEETENIIYEYSQNEGKGYLPDGSIVEDIELDEKGRILSTKNYANGELQSEIFYEYQREENNVLSKRSHILYEDGKIHIESIYKYNEKGELITQENKNYYDIKDNRNYSDSLTKYNKYGEKISEKVIRWNVEENIYEEDNYIIKYKKSTDNKYCSVYRYKYNENGELEGGIKIEEYEYDEHGNRIYYSQLTREGEPRVSWYYEYDENGNKLVERRYDYDKLYSTTTYSYYD